MSMIPLARDATAVSAASSKRIGLAVVAYVAAALAAVPALAAPAKRGNEDLKKYCSGDALTYCGDIDPDSREMEACFKTHRAELSENCRRAITAYEGQGRR